MYFLFIILISLIQGTTLFFGGKLILKAGSYLLSNTFNLLIIKDKSIQRDSFISLFLQLFIGIVIIKVGFTLVNFLQVNVLTEFYTQYIGLLYPENLKFSYIAKTIGTIIGLYITSIYKFPTYNNFKNKNFNKQLIKKPKEDKTPKNNQFSNPNKESYSYNKEHLLNKKKPFKHKVTSYNQKKEPYTEKKRSNISKNNSFRYKK